MVESTMELLDWFRKQVEQADGDVLQEMLHIFAETLMDADASAACNAGFNEKSPDRTNTRNGYRFRRNDPADLLLGAHHRCHQVLTGHGLLRGRHPQA
ncbi:MAG TPA: transposase [Candidatus Anoxymicrobiaceae bacterium]